MFGEKIIERNAICTLDNGYKFRAVFQIKQSFLSGGVSHKELERTLVKDFNDAQPLMAPKLTKVHLMRN